MIAAIVLGITLMSGSPISGQQRTFAANSGDSNYQAWSPIIVATDRNAKYELTSAADGVSFDIDADGVPEQIAWTKADSSIAFLALDRDGDGKITSGKELFGSFTVPGAANGFVALKELTLASNGGVLRGSVSSDDPIFGRLLLWTDSNHNGFSEQWELRPASELLSDVGLGYTIFKNKADEFGNLFSVRGWAHVRTQAGRNRVKSADEDRDRTIQIWDVYLKILR